jgi:D-alanyl-D-alanine carboxypeptidase
MSRHHLWIAALLAGTLTTAAPAAAEPSLEATLLPVVTGQMVKMGIPGVIVSVQTPDRGSWQAALGVSDIVTRTPMDVADHVRIGSITKSLTATVILQLAQEGRLRLDDPLAPYFPGVQTNRATIRQALQLTSGIADYTTDAFLNALAVAPQRVWSPANYVMLGIVAEQVTGQPLRRLIADRIFGPLNMTGCSFPDAADSTIAQPSSRGYMLSTKWDRPPTPPAPLPPLVDVTDFNPSWAAGAGQAICTAADLAVWGRALATGELLDPDMQAQRLTFYTTGDPHARYGLGVVDINGLVGHNGEISGFMSQAARRESDGTVIVVLSNLMIAPDLTEPATAISELISRAIPPKK